MKLSEYQVAVRVNGRLWKRLFISDHFEQKHKDHMSDELIIKLVGSINGEHFAIQDVRSDGHKILVVDPLYYVGKSYRLILTFHPDQDYLGVINAFRRRIK